MSHTLWITNLQRSNFLISRDEYLAPESLEPGNHSVLFFLASWSLFWAREKVRGEGSYISTVYFIFIYSTQWRLFQLLSALAKKERGLPLWSCEFCPTITVPSARLLCLDPNLSAWCIVTIVFKFYYYTTQNNFSHLQLLDNLDRIMKTTRVWFFRATALRKCKQSDEHRCSPSLTIAPRQLHEKVKKTRL